MSCMDDYISNRNIRLLPWRSKAAQRSSSGGKNMLFSAVVAGLIGLACASPAPKPASETNLARRQSGPNYPVYTFDQLIDHFPDSDRYTPHTNDTFKQRYVYDSTYYKPGGPIFLYIGGETSVESRLENIESGTIADNAYFAQHVQLPSINGSINAPDTPWILYGGSLAGAQTAFSVKTYGDILYGGIAASAPIHVVLGYSEWYAPIQKFAPQDCVASINAIIDKMDYLISTNNTAAIQELKSIFGLGSLGDIRDFAMTIAFPLGGPMNYPTNTWQELNWSPLYGSNDFWNFCNNVSDINAPANITAVDNQLAKYTNGEPWTNLGNYANYVKQIVLPYCTSGDYDSTNDGCFSTQNVSYWADTTNSGGRSYLYSTCIEQGAYQVAPPSGPSLVSRVLQVDYTQQWCTWAFPAGEYNTIPSTPDLTQYTKYGDFNFSAPRLAFIDGNQDVWLDLCYHSNDAPARYSSDLHPEHLIAGAGHHWDSYGIKDIPAEPQFIRNAHYWEIRTVQKWLRSRQSSSKRDQVVKGREL
ncbi:MAG: hypothetical protein Q9157_006194 [Trypethelium eluteriae]